jgi:hypothetical protein
MNAQKRLLSSLLIGMLTVAVIYVGKPSLGSQDVVEAASVEILDVETTAPLQTEVCAEADTFLDVTTYVQTQNYPAPELNVYCQNGVMIVESNGIPNFEFVSITPNDLQAQNHHFEIPLNPVLSDQASDIPLLGTVAVAVNGLPIFGPNEAPRDDYGDPFLDQILDYCNGHTAQGGLYHFHARPDCLFTDSEGNTSLVVAWSFDGYPILAPYICVDAACTDVQKVQSSWVRTSDVRNAWEAHEYVEGSGDLDECNGMIGPDGTYRYYATDTFPYFLGCYRGVAADNGFLNVEGGQPTGDGVPDAGQPDNVAPADGGQNGNGGPPNGGQGGNGGNGGPPNGDQDGNGRPRPPRNGQGGGRPPRQ